MKLSPAMHRALRQIQREPNRHWTEYEHVGLRTIRALESRGLIELGLMAGHVTLTDRGRRAHAHVFQLVAHIDGCHHFSNAAKCECGATYNSYGERDLKGDPWSMIWMTDDEGDSKCDRCTELLDGARPIWREQIVEPKKKAAA